MWDLSRLLILCASISWPVKWSCVSLSFCCETNHSKLSGLKDLFSLWFFWEVFLILGVADLMHIQSAGGLGGVWLISDGFTPRAVGWLSAEVSGSHVSHPAVLHGLLHMMFGFQEQKVKPFSSLSLHHFCPIGESKSHSQSKFKRREKVNYLQSIIAIFFGKLP